MKSIFITCALGACGIAYGAEYKLEKREPVSHVFQKDSALDVDNVNGSVTVIGDNAGTIRVEGEKVVRADDQAELERGNREVVLDMNEKEGVAQLYVNGPFRGGNHANDTHGFHEHTDRRYEVTYNLTIHVPQATVLKLRSVNGGVKATDTTGAFDVNAVNGAIAMTRIAGAGRANTVNGPMSIAFAQNPRADSSFKTVNGRIDVSLQPSLSADIKVRTLNGQAYTDFETTSAGSAPNADVRQGRLNLRTHDLQNFRVGSGGPELRFETVNGEIRIHKQSR